MKKTVLITGAAKGIGAACTQSFAEAGYNVVINYNTSADDAKELYNRLSSQSFSVSLYKADISKEADAEALVKHTIDTFGSLDVLVNNAGISQTKLFTDITLDDWNNMFDINTKGVFLVTKAAVRHMVSQKYGRIINISSIWGVSGASCEVHYSASKAAVIGMSKALAKELAPSNITVNCIAPGAIKTDMLNEYTEQELKDLEDRILMGRLGSPEDIAGSALFFASDNASYITGQVLVIDGGFCC